MEFVVNMGFYQSLHNRHTKLTEKVKPNLKKSIWDLSMYDYSKPQSDS